MWQYIIQDIQEKAEVQKTTRNIVIWNSDFTVEIPENMDIYEGLRLYYPELYNEVINEEEFNRQQTISLSHEDEDNYMDYLDYLEWMYD